MRSLLANIKNYYEKEKLEKTKKKKVTRKNKYSGKRVAAGVIAILVIEGCAYGMFKGDTSASEITTDEVVETFDLGVDYDVPIKIEYEEEINTPKVEIEIPDEDVKMVSLDYEDRSSTPKANTARENYVYLIDKYSGMYGLDSKLVLGIATQERGIHSSNMDAGGATGLMQIQNSVWIGEEVTAYNFELGKNETIKVDSNNIKQLETNIKIGCMILQNCFRYMKYNPLASIQCYNMGYGNMKKILNSYSSDSTKSVDEILSDIYDTGWIDYRNLIKVGDQNYIENVLSWIGPNVELHIVGRNGNLIDLKINNEISNKKVY